MGNPIGPYRVWLQNIELPGLAMTRSFGDKIGVQAGVIGEPGTLFFIRPSHFSALLSQCVLL